MKNLEQKMAEDLPCIRYLKGYCEIFVVFKRRRRVAIAFLDGFVLGCFCLLGLGLFAACGCKRLEKAIFFFYLPLTEQV